MLRKLNQFENWVVSSWAENWSRGSYSQLDTSTIQVNWKWVVRVCKWNLLRSLQKQNVLHFTVFSIFFFSTTFVYWLLNISEFRAKEYFTDHQSVNTIQLFVAIKRHFSGLSFSWMRCNKVQIPRDYLINVATCLFACH